jgi:hypothetical protein
MIHAYANTAARDADLAGLGALDHAFAYVDASSTVTYWTGTTWRTLGPGPFAEASGLSTGWSAGTLASGTAMNSTVTFPTGRFTVAPIVSVNLVGVMGGTANLTCRVGSVTATTVSIYVYNVGSASATFSGLSVAWQAKQMTPTAAAG